MNNPKKCIRWATADWEPASETFMVSLRFDTAPPEQEWLHLGLGKAEMKELVQVLNKALRSKTKSCKGKSL